jgi:hypothetical protein
VNQQLVCPYNLANRKGCDGLFFTHSELAWHLAHEHFEEWAGVAGAPTSYICWCGVRYYLSVAFPGDLLSRHLEDEGGALAHYLAVKFRLGFVYEKEVDASHVQEQ